MIAAWSTAATLGVMVGLIGALLGLAYFAHRQGYAAADSAYRVKGARQKEAQAAAESKFADERAAIRDRAEDAHEKVRDGDDDARATILHGLLLRRGARDQDTV